MFLRFRKVISVSLSPNVQKRDVFLALALLFQPWRWKKGAGIKKLEGEFAKILGAKEAISVDSGRSALLVILKAMGVGEGDEILVSGYTCSVVPNAVIFAGATSVYIDIEEETFNMNIDLMEEAITSKTKVIIVQHTFGVSVEMERIMKIARKHNLQVVEDCAHALGSTYHDQQVGSFGDAAMFSFGRDKIISSVHGGMITTSNEELAGKIRSIQNSLSLPSTRRIFQHLFHPIAFSIILPLYRLVVGKVILVALQKLKLISLVYEKGEKKGVCPKNHPARFPNVLSILALSQLKRLDMFNDHRKKLARLYFEKLKNNSDFQVQKFDENSVHLMYTVLSEKASEMRAKMKAHGVILGAWWGKGIVPNDVNLRSVKYDLGSCPVAEKMGMMALNLPTNVNTSTGQAEWLVNLLANS